jgi:hypothetical protein
MSTRVGPILQDHLPVACRMAGHTLRLPGADPIAVVVSRLSLERPPPAEAARQREASRRRFAA